MGLDRSAKLIPALNGLFMRRAVPLFRASAFDATEERLRTYTSESASQTERGAAYNDLRAYLLLGPEVGRLQASPGERAFLKAYLQRAPGARPHVPVSKDAPLAEFEQVAMAFPVFRVVSTVHAQPCKAREQSYYTHHEVRVRPNRR